MVAYVVFGLEEVSDPQGLQDYRVAGAPTLAPAGGRFVAGSQVVRKLEGDRVDQLVVLEFPDVEAAEKWYDSPEYQEVAKIRFAATKGFAVIVKGR